MKLQEVGIIEAMAEHRGIALGTVRVRSWSRRRRSRSSGLILRVPGAAVLGLQSFSGCITLSRVAAVFTGASFLRGKQKQFRDISNDGRRMIVAGTKRIASVCSYATGSGHNASFVLYPLKFISPGCVELRWPTGSCIGGHYQPLYWTPTSFL